MSALHLCFRSVLRARVGGISGHGSAARLCNVPLRICPAIPGAISAGPSCASRPPAQEKHRAARGSRRCASKERPRFASARQDLRAARTHADDDGARNAVQVRPRKGSPAALENGRLHLRRARELHVPVCRLPAAAIEGGRTCGTQNGGNGPPAVLCGTSGSPHLKPCFTYRSRQRESSIDSGGFDLYAAAASSSDGKRRRRLRAPAPEEARAWLF